MWLLSAAQRRSINVRGAYLEVLGDLIGSAAVIVAAIVILTTGWMQADAIASLFIAAMIMPARDRAAARGRLGARRVGARRARTSRRSASTSSRTPGVVDVHDVHVWQLTRGAPVFTRPRRRRRRRARATAGRPASSSELQGCLVAALRRRALDLPARARRSRRARRARLSARHRRRQSSRTTSSGLLSGRRPRQRGVAQDAAGRELGELHLADELRPHPQRVAGVERRARPTNGFSSVRSGSSFFMSVASVESLKPEPTRPA